MCSVILILPHLQMLVRFSLMGFKLDCVMIVITVFDNDTKVWHTCKSSAHICSNHLIYKLSV